jgi:hypothetical protein
MHDKAAEAAKLQNMFMMNNKDLVKRGTIEEMEQNYTVVQSLEQSHANVVTSIVESKYKERFFCKTINHLEDLSRGEVADSLLAVRYVTELQHPNMLRPKEIYGNPNKLCLLSPLLEESHESLLSYVSSGEESDILN